MSDQVDNESTGRRARRSAAAGGRTPAFALLVLGAVAVVAMATVPWYYVDSRTRFSGTAITGGAAEVLGVVVLAGALLMIALRTTGRRVVAVVIGVIAVLAVIFLPWQRPDADEVLAELRKHSLSDTYALHLTGGSLGYLVSWLAVLAGAVLVVLYAHRWPQRAARFERNAVRTGIPVGPDGEPDAAAIWKAIDSGQDPTRDDRHDTSQESSHDISQDSSDDTSQDADDRTRS